MKDIDVSNNNLIKEYVKKYFSLDAKSYDYFQKEIDNPSLDDYFKSIFTKKETDNFRAYYDIPKEMAASIDEGWKDFASTFRTFVAVNNFNYTNFVENRVLINKNQIKTRKALLMFYLNYANLMYAKEDIVNKRIAVPTSELISFKVNNKPSEWLEKEMTSFIDASLESISKKCLPKSSIKLVVSCNFADWFLCSTAESWRSCLNLESEFHGAYWTGLPGLIGDKNRCMIYVTDGTKKKYKGIEVDKVIARSWGLLSDDNELHMIKPYPLADIVNADMISGIIGLTVRPITNPRFEFTSKHRVNLLHFNDDSKPSAFIFQDYTAFDNSARLVKGHNAFYCFVNGKLKAGEPAVNYTGGFSRLIENNEEVLDYLIKLRECEKCHYVGQEVQKITVEGQEYTLCPNCLSKLFKKCAECKQWHSIKNMEKVEGTGRDIYVCKSCVGKSYVYCDDCRKVYAKSSLRKIVFSNGNKLSVCDSCFDTAYSEMKLHKCNRCGSYHESELIKTSYCHDEESDDEYLYCEPCIKTMTDRKQYKFSFETQDKFTFKWDIPAGMGNIPNFEVGAIPVPDGLARMFEAGAPPPPPRPVWVDEPAEAAEPNEEPDEAMFDPDDDDGDEVDF